MKTTKLIGMLAAGMSLVGAMACSNSDGSDEPTFTTYPTEEVQAGEYELELTMLKLLHLPPLMNSLSTFSAD